MRVVLLELEIYWLQPSRKLEVRLGRRTCGANSSYYPVRWNSSPSMVPAVFKHPFPWNTGSISIHGPYHNPSYSIDWLLHCVSDIPNFSLILVFYVVHASTDASNKAYILKMLDGVAGARQSVKYRPAWLCSESESCPMLTRWLTALTLDTESGWVPQVPTNQMTSRNRGKILTVSSTVAVFFFIDSDGGVRIMFL